MWESKTEVYVHFVWNTYDRRTLVREEIRVPLLKWFQRVGKELGCGVIAVGVMPDHVHILVRMSPLHTVAEVVKRLKGSSSRFLNEEFGEKTWFRWQRGYGAFSVSRWDVSRVAKYVLNQEEHHSMGTTASSLEPELEDGLAR